MIFLGGVITCICDGLSRYATRYRTRNRGSAQGSRRHRIFYFSPLEGRHGAYLLSADPTEDDNGRGGGKDHPAGGRPSLEQKDPGSTHSGQFTRRTIAGAQ